MIYLEETTRLQRHHAALVFPPCATRAVTFGRRSACHGLVDRLYTRRRTMQQLHLSRVDAAVKFVRSIYGSRMHVQSISLHARTVHIRRMPCVPTLPFDDAGEGEERLNGVRVGVMRTSAATGRVRDDNGWSLESAVSAATGPSVG
jgi:hypothetical protein